VCVRVRRESQGSRSRSVQMIARRVATCLAAKGSCVRLMSAAAPGGDWIVSPSAGTLLASNPSIDIKALAAKCAGHSPGSGKVIITKVRPMSDSI
jgi:hypothetical protein